jgi:protein involved in polysaccharide export with SLBB domain
MYCQQGEINPADFKSIKVDALTNAQIQKFVDKYTADGYTIEQVEEQALIGGMPAAEWQKLKTRIQSLTSSDMGHDYRSYSREIESGAAKQAAVLSVDEEKGTRIFGASLFNTSNLTFEPNLRLPTPVDYQLGPDDELIVDVYGLSDASWRATVSNEGYIRLPIIGQIQVSGMTIEQAKKSITRKVAANYAATVGSGQTAVSVTLGNIRSIKILVVGEAHRPGTYTLPSVSSVYNTLNACGGPNRNGSFRDIKVIRNDKIIATIDIYDFLLTGEMKNNIRLQDRDVIKIEPYKKRIELKGEVKNTGYFEAKDRETLENMLTYAGGFTTNAYKGRVVVFRNTDKEKRVADIGSTEFNSFVTEDGDVFVVGPLLDRFENRVQINGAVYRPGVYAMSKDMTLKQLIDKADGLKEDAFMHRGTIIREKDNLETEMLSFSPEDVINGKVDITLKREDVVSIASLLSLQETKYVYIYGEVRKTGEYLYHEHMTLQDLVFSAGGINDRAELRNIEVYREITDPDALKDGTDIAKEYKFTIDKTLNGLDFELQPRDNVVIRPISGYSDTKKVMVEGEVYFPGNYVITRRNDRISNVIEQAGGLNRYAYPQGAFLIRKNEVSIAESKVEQNIAEGLPSDLIEAEKLVAKESIVGINLENIMKAPGSKWDLLLEDGDIIRIPREMQTVQVSGEVLFPSLVRYDKSFSFGDYISNSGGFSSKALKSKAYVIYANGTSKATKRFLWFKNYPEVTPGAKIYVPEKPERTNKVSISEGIALTSSVITTAALIMNLLK